MLTFSGCIFENYDNWKTISFGDYGKIKIPEEWSMYHDGEFYYILNEKDEPMLVQTSSIPDYYEDVPVGPEKNDYCNALIRKKVTFNATNSLGMAYGILEIDRDGYISSNYYLDFPKPEGEREFFFLIFWDENVEEDYVLKFVKSYDPPDHDEPKTTWDTYAC